MNTSQLNNFEVTQRLFVEHRDEVYRQTDMLFVALLCLQFLFGLMAALVFSPQTWIGETPYTHVHVWASIGIGGLLSAFPIFMCFKFPGQTLTRHVVAVAQVGWSALLIHLLGGRIEAHFHIFGSLAFLAFYRDWKVILTATIVVAADHFVRGIWWPQSVYGIATESPFRWMEHAAWVLFEDVFLFISCWRATKEGWQLSERQAELANANSEIEFRVAERTVQLLEAQEQLENELVEREKTDKEKETLYRELSTASRRAGMAEVATGVLHNVGNVLNSVNVSANLVASQLRKSRVERLAMASEIIQENKNDLANFLENTKRGKSFPAILETLAKEICHERDTELGEMQTLIDNIEHVKEIVAMQQSVARSGGALERIPLADLVGAALKVIESSILSRDIKIEQTLDFNAAANVDRHKVLQIMINLIGNAKHACVDSGQEEKRIRLLLKKHDGKVRFEVHDNGIGIPRENLNRIFNHGFTTKKNGHGFGLHSSANAAKELGGDLNVTSSGKGQGACFTLELPDADFVNEELVGSLESTSASC